ncbi:MAG: hypothetical protein HY706_00735 [Candidatus Hydrogenedentes bacterium]|nr:hypothetical protein [Candidatus Hydrogenedentota bacterium]
MRSGPFSFVSVLSILFLSSSVFATDLNPPSLDSEGGAWPIRRQWTVAETSHFAEWVQHIFEVKCNGTREQRLAKLERVLTDPEMNLLLLAEFAGEGSNPQLDLHIIRAMHRVLDCAKLTVALSTYYSYRRALPWIASCVRASDGGDLRTAAYTIPSGTINSFEYDSAAQFIGDAITGTCTGNFRVELSGPNSQLSDTLPVAIGRDHLIPGCLYYLDGHVLILAKITRDGEPRFLDATIAATRDIYAFNGGSAITGLTPKNSAAPGNEYAGCYRGFRVYRWPIAEVDGAGKIVAVRRRTDNEMKEFGFSTEQYDKLEELTRHRQIVEDGAGVINFHQFIRMRLRTTHRFNLAAQLETAANELLTLLQQREERVQQAWRDVTANGPVPFPEEKFDGNVFTEGGRWGAYATALDDAAFRAKYFELMERVDAMIGWFDLRTDEVNLEALNEHAIWTHADLAAALLEAKKRLFGETTFEYLNSAGKPVRLSLLDVEQRLYDLSFDPNHPPELRWGAAPGSPEAESAREMPTPITDGTKIAMDEAFHREAYYRSLIRWEPDPSYLRGMITQGFPVLAKLDERLRQRWFDGPSPPLVPYDGKAAWLREQSAQ